MKEMIECKVLEVDSKMAKVREQLHGDCNSCGICEGSPGVFYDADNTIGAKVGQKVLLEVEKQSVLEVSFTIFVLPLLAVMVGCGLGYGMAQIFDLSNVVTMLPLSLIALIPVLFYIRRYDKKAQNQSQIPVITKILNE